MKDTFCGAGDETEDLPGDLYELYKKNSDQRIKYRVHKGHPYDLCTGPNCEGFTDEDDLTRADRKWVDENFPEMHPLIKKGIVFVGCDHDTVPVGKCLCINVNDTFFYACGDAERVAKDQSQIVIDIYDNYGDVGLVCWVAKQRGYDPVIEYTEDPVYQDTWRKLYGSLKVDATSVQGRWSSRKLNLKPWEPKK